MSVNTYTTQNFQQQVIEASYQQPVLVDFWAPWCGPCRQVGPVIERVAETLDGKASVGKVNVDDNAELASQFQITSIPNVLVFRNGEVVESLVGVRSELDYVAASEAASLETA